MKKMLSTYISLGTTMYGFFNSKNTAETNYQININTLKNDEFKLCIEYKKYI
jgi:hypothetical protein